MTFITQMAMKFNPDCLNPRFLRSLVRISLATTWFLLASQTLAAQASINTSPLDQVAVIVNDDVITETELQARIKLVVSNLKGKKSQLPSTHILRKQVLNNMVLESIQVQRAKEAGIEVTDIILERAFSDLAARNGISPSQLRKTLKKDGVNIDAFKDQLRSQTAIQQLISREVSSRVRITSQDVDSYLRKRDQQQDNGIQYNISHILLTTPEKALQSVIQRIKKQAEQVYKQIQSGESFEKLAIANSKDQYALKGGLIGWRTTGQMPELFVQALQNLKPGEASSVLKSSNGFHILKLNKKRGGVNPSFRVTQTHARHILLKREAGLTDRYLRQRLNQLRQRIIDGEDFGKLARVHSDDIASAVNNGDLDWVTPGVMVPSFEKAMARLKPGVISQIVESPYGFHIIEVLGRRQKDIGKEKLRADARRELHIRKAEEYYQVWIRRLRDQAYVEYAG